MKRAHTANDKRQHAEAFRRQDPARRPECVIDARLETTPATGDRILATLGAGARDFVLASTDGRLSARVRLTVASVAMTEHRVGGTTLIVDWSQSTVANGPRRETLSRTELRLLAALLEGVGRTLTRTALIEHMWPDDARAMAERENSLAVYVCSLRKRLTSVGAGSALRTVRGVGYHLSA